MIIVLTPEETASARAVGLKREGLRKARGKSPEEYADAGGSHDDRHSLGAVAEYALAKQLDVLADWIESKAFSLEHWKIPCDVGLNLHVRATTRPTGGLILHPYDPDDGAFVLAIISPYELPGTRVAFVGWSLARYVKVPSFWKNKGPGFGRPGRAAYLVPQRVLNPMDSLPKEYVR